MTIITRHSVSDNFSFTAIEENNSFTKKELDNKIDDWKYLLTYKCKAKRQESILIGITTINLDYIAICFAALELSLKLVIVDYNRKDEFTDLEYKDPKTKILSPIDIFLHDVAPEFLNKDATPIKKFMFFTNHSKRTYNTHTLDRTIDKNDYEKTKHILPSKTDIAIRCTSSGTTGTPKIVEHTHEFLYQISQRNSTKFYGDCIHIRNLNHGSSIAVFLLPSLISKNVKTHLAFNLDDHIGFFDVFIKGMKKYKNSLSFINFPYPYMIDQFIDSSIENNINWPALNVQTLSYIQDKSKKAVKDNVFKSITSIFGSNETSGPVFECTITKDSLDKNSSYFTKLDDFYDISLDAEGLIHVGMPVYKDSIITNDIFKIRDNFYIHSGRKDIVKINGEILDYKIINDLNATYPQSYIVVDSLHNNIYLAFWTQQDDKIYKKINKFFSDNYDNVKINKTLVLNKDRFLSGIKIDNELLREKFRNV